MFKRHIKHALKWLDGLFLSEEQPRIPFNHLSILGIDKLKPFVPPPKGPEGQIAIRATLAERERCLSILRDELDLEPEEQSELLSRIVSGDPFTPRNS